MKHASPLPSFFVKRYVGWKATQFSENKAWYERLVNEGQRPRAMVISCCDSRVHITSIFGADTGEIFIHRNIANLIPPYNPDEHFHGTSAAIEYAVTALKVTNLIVLGHSHCGGVEACFDKCTGNFAQETSFVGKWIEILRPGFERLEKTDEKNRDTLEQLEKNSVVVSLENLMTFPFVEEAVKNETLMVHGLWNDIASGGIEYFDSETESFKAISI